MGQFSRASKPGRPVLRAGHLREPPRRARGDVESFGYVLIEGREAKLVVETAIEDLAQHPAHLEVDGGLGDARLKLGVAPTCLCAPAARSAMLVIIVALLQFEWVV